MSICSQDIEQKKICRKSRAITLVQMSEKQHAINPTQILLISIHIKHLVKI